MVTVMRYVSLDSILIRFLTLFDGLCYCCVRIGPDGVFGLFLLVLF